MKHTPRDPDDPDRRTLSKPLIFLPSEIGLIYYALTKLLASHNIPTHLNTREEIIALRIKCRDYLD